MTRKTLRLATPRPVRAASTTPRGAAPAAPARKAGVRMLKARERSGEPLAVPAKADRPPRREGDRPPRREGDRPPRREGDRPPRREGDRPPRREGDRPPRREGDRPPRREGDRPPRREGAARPWAAAPVSAPAVDGSPATRRRRERLTDDRPTQERQRPAPARPVRPARADAARAGVDRPAADARPVPPPSPASAAAVGDERVRVSKLLAQQGLCSRREADEYIERGWVFANGERVTELGTRVAADAVLRLDRQARAARVRLATIVLNKPVGYVSGQPEDDHPPAVTLIRPEHLWDASPAAPGDEMARFDPVQLRGLAPAGRLDIDSTGLLILTQDGTVARRLIGADSDVEKEYLVRVEGQLIDGGLALLQQGLELDDQPLRPAEVEWINDDQLRFVLREGRKRQIRRMCEAVGLHVTGLKRVRIGKVMLGDLPPGRWRFLGAEERF